MKNHFIPIVAGLILIPAVSLATEPGGFFSPEEVHQMIDQKCVYDEEDCPDMLDHQCALQLLQELHESGQLEFHVFVEMRHYIELERAHMQGFHEGFMAGVLETVEQCSMQPKPGGEQGGNNEQEGGHVTLCHVPPGNPDNAHTITVGAAAVEAHLNHGDKPGPCEGDDGDDDDHEVGKKKNKKGKKRGKKKRKKKKRRS